MLFPAKQKAYASCSYWFPLPLKSYRDNMVGFFISSGHASQLRNSKLRKPESFIKTNKQSYWKEKLFLLYWTVNKSALHYRGKYYVCVPRWFVLLTYLKR